MKAILVIDMPKTCEDCPCNQIEESYGSINRTFCGITDNTTSLSGKLENCPLKPLPEYQEEKIANYVDNYDYERGWNNCLDEIIGE